jgi:hypothetical protein
MILVNSADKKISSHILACDCVLRLALALAAE